MSASWAWGPELSVDSETARACAVTCEVGAVDEAVLAGSSPVALAEGTNHRAHRTVPAAVAVSNGRRADDTEYRSPCGAGELAVWGDVSERRGSQESHGSPGPYAPGMNIEETSRFVRLRVELVLEIEDPGALTKAALRRLAAETDMPADERVHAEGAVTEDTAEALASLIDPFDLVSEVPGVDLAQASWSSEPIDYDPDSPDWDLDEDDVDEDDEDEGADGVS